MKYIAYGSNMSVSQMARRCPDAFLLGTGYIEGWRLEFYLHATVERTGNPRDLVPVAVWEISPADEARLDRYEGVPAYYTKETEKAVMADGSEIEGLIYIMAMVRPGLPARDYYLGIAFSYLDLGFQDEYETVILPAYVRAMRRSDACA